MKRRLVAQKLIERLNERIQHQLNLRKTVILGVVLKGLPVAYGLAKMNEAAENFVPLVAQRHIYMQHHVESYFPSTEWEIYFSRLFNQLDRILIVDDVVNTGFTRQKVEGIVCSLEDKKRSLKPSGFAALVLNRKNLANPNFVSAEDFYAVQVNAENVECDWGLVTVPLWDLAIETARHRCEEYYQRFWQSEQREIVITY